MRNSYSSSNKNYTKNNYSEMTLDKIVAVDKTEENPMKPNFNNQKAAQRFVSQVHIDPPCNSEECTCDNFGNTITFTAWARIPAGFQLISLNPEFMFNTDDLRCAIETCSVPIDTVPNPCDPTQTITGCSVNLRRIKIYGAFRYYVDVFYATGNPGGGVASPGNEGVLFIDQTLQFTCDCDVECPETVTVEVTDLVVGRPQVGPNGDTFVPVVVTLVLSI